MNMAINNIVWTNAWVNVRGRVDEINYTIKFVFKNKVSNDVFSNVDTNTRISVWDNISNNVRYKVYERIFNSEIDDGYTN